MKLRLTSTAVGLALCAAGMAAVPAAASPILVMREVFAAANSTSGGTALDTGVEIAAGERLQVWVDPLDCWSAGAANRISNANGLDGNSPAPCQPTGNFGFWSQDGESFRFGALVGRIDAGDWFLLGTSFDQIMSDSGRLFLAYWDSNASDNFGSVAASIEVRAANAAVPVPGTLALIALGAYALRRRLLA